MYLLDTNILSNLMQPNPSQALQDRLLFMPSELLFTSTVSVGEAVAGAHLRPATVGRRLQMLAAVLANCSRILPFDAPSAYRYGRLWAYLEGQGARIGVPDTQIAAIALEHDLTVVTDNVRQFSRIPGLPIENWIRP